MLLRLTYVAERATPTRLADATCVTVKAADANAVHTADTVRPVDSGNAT